MIIHNAGAAVHGVHKGLDCIPGLGELLRERQKLDGLAHCRLVVRIRHREVQNRHAVIVDAHTERRDARLRVVVAANEELKHAFLLEIRGHEDYALLRLDPDLRVVGRLDELAVFPIAAELECDVRELVLLMKMGLELVQPSVLLLGGGEGNWAARSNTRC